MTVTFFEVSGRRMHLHATTRKRWICRPRIPGGGDTSCFLLTPFLYTFTSGWQSTGYAMAFRS